MDGYNNLVNNTKIELCLVCGMLGLTVISGVVASSIRVNADDNDTAVTTASVTVAASCSMTATVDTPHNATLANGIYSASTTDYADGIGKTTIATFCNDNSGYAIYAIGYTGDKYEGEDHTKLIGATNGQKIATGTATSGSASNWAMKLTKVTDSSVSYNPENLTITNDYDDYNVIPNTYTKVANYSSTTDQTLGSVLSTTYAAYISPTEVADTYTGKVKYTLVHPNTEVPSQPQACVSGKICYYANASDVVGTMGYQDLGDHVTTTFASAKLRASNFSREGYGFAGWSDVFDYDTNPNAHFYGPQEYIRFTEGQYSGANPGLSLYAVWVKSAGSLQDTSKVAQLCGTGSGSLTTAPTNGTANLSSVSALTDERDNQTYAIAKLADGKCWMIENLRLDDTATLTLANTNNPLNDGTNVTLKHNYTDTDVYATLSASSSVAYDADTASDGWCTDVSAACFDQSRLRTDNTANRATDNPNSDGLAKYSYGNYYNWYSATAGRGTFSFGTNNNSTIGDLCPTGWRLPTAGRTTVNTTADFYLLSKAIMDGVEPDRDAASGYGQYEETVTNIAGKTANMAIRSFPNNYLWSGFVNDESLGSLRGAASFYWSSTVQNVAYAYSLYMNSYDLSPGTYSDIKNLGGTLRCVANLY